MKILLLMLMYCASAIASDKWNTAEQHIPADTIQFESDEGTWMNLDVSPDGKWIAFDMLGDIYIMPFTGGEAKVIAEGLPFEVQPRFSPDSKKISFTSDRAGGDNIWIMNADGTEKKQVTKENFRLLNNAVWTKDGNFLIARKHFTSTRSLGAGEMWMYHISGGAGLQITRRKNDQQDVNEPALSPDGRYLYFCEDMYPGGYFQYNKNVYKTIYVVRRVDLQTGKIKDIISVNGGAVRPTISPNGKTIAFVRRVRTKSVLCLFDIASGRITPLYDNLTRDQQEAWAIFGLYPNFAWTPDGKDLIFWSNGKIHKINIQSREISEIPFKVMATHSIANALRFKNKAFKETFETKMIRHAVTSPDGKIVVYTALGQLWKKNLPDGKPQRLTDSPDREFEPAFSNNGEWIVFASWDDQKQGSISKIKLSSGKIYKVTQRPGFYHTPKFSYDDRNIVYLRDSGDRVLGTENSTETGIYLCDSEGKKDVLISESGTRPMFNKNGQRVFYMDYEGEDKILNSVDLNGQDKQTIFKSKYATEIVPSPDENWVAFKDLYQVYVIPFPKTGQTTDLSGDLKSLPKKKVSRDAGRDVHWSNDSQKLHWITGPEYFTRDLKETFAFIAGAPGSIPLPDSSGIHLGFMVKSDVPDSKIAFKGARIITMNGDEVIEDGVIIVDKNKIESIGPQGTVNIPENIKVVDVSGKTIIPGLIDVHAHLANHWSSSGIYPMQDWSYFANLAYGVTATHDPSTNTEMSFGQAEMVEAGKMIGPRIFSTGTILYGADGDFKVVVDSLNDARSHLRRLKSVGAFSVKSYNQPRREQRQQIIRAAYELGIEVVPEGGSTFFHNMTMILDGHTGIEHNIPVQPVYKDVLTLWGSSHTGYTPTLIVSYAGLSGEFYWYQHMDVWQIERLMTFTPRSIIDPRSIRREMAPEDDYGHIRISQAVKKLSDAGVKVNLGAHGQLQGLGAHWELWMLAQGGMTPMEALRCATINGAGYIGMADEIGSIQKGKLADMVVLDKNPLENIRNSEYVNMVMINGRLFDAATMNEIGNYDKKRQPFYWENNSATDVFEWHEATHDWGCSCGRGNH